MTKQEQHKLMIDFINAMVKSAVTKMKESYQLTPLEKAWCYSHITDEREFRERCYAHRIPNAMEIYLN